MLYDMILQVLTTHPWMFVLYAFLIGAVLGSFVNAAIYRLPRDISMFKRSRSFCPHCENSIAWYDNIPIISYVLLLLGRCRACKKPIPARYLIVELLVATLFAVSAWQYLVLNQPATPNAANPMPWILAVVQLFLIADLICIAFTDLETWYIPFPTTLPWILLGLIVAPIFPELHLSATEWTASPRVNAFIDSFQGVVIGAGCLWAVGFACIVLLGKQGMGGGDAHMVAMIGALLGWKPAVATLFLGVFLGSFIGIGSILIDHFQQWRLGDHWKPRQPTFPMPEGEEEDPGPPPAWPLLVMGLIVLAFEGTLIAIASVGPEAYWYEKPYFSASFGILIGLFLLLAYPMQRRMIAEGRWPQGDIQEREDGSKEEVLQGNYIPFGPSLALAGLIVVFYDPLIRSFAWWWLFRNEWELLPFKLPLVG